MKTLHVAIVALCISTAAFGKSSVLPDTALQNLQLPDVAITSVSHESMPADVGTGDITFYDVEGIIGGTIKFELLLPDAWNKRFVMGGGGGFVGTVQNAARSSVKQGYATVGTDTGHEGTDGSFALDDALAQVNFGHVAVHRTAEVAKAIIREHYGADPEYAYFIGCSRGGGQAMMASQRYPEDFDGILAGAPAFNWTGIAAAFLNVTQAFYPDPNDVDSTVLSQKDIGRLREEITSRFDAQDVLEDGIISDPAAVELDLDSIAWLTDEQREAISTIYDGVGNQDGEIFTGFPVSSEMEWFNWLVGPIPNNDAPSLAYHFGVDVFKYFVFNDSDWDYSDYDFSTFAQDTRLTASTLNATDTDLSAFRDRGGKIIFWHGWSDAALSAYATIDYYDELRERDPKAVDYTRLYLIPGCGHCGGGPGISTVDWLEVIVQWVEHEKAPDVVTASRRREGDQPPITRPLSPYPKETVYSGTGDPNSAGSFQSRF